MWRRATYSWQTSPTGGGTHLNDVTLIMPVFHEDEALFMLVNKGGHWSEVGGGMRMGGSWSPDATEIYQEGTQFPNVRIGRDDRIDEEIVRIIEANSRTPEMTLGDMEAQVASMRVARNRILRLIDRYGSEAVRASVESSILAGEMKARELLRALPHGSFEIEDFIDDDGINEEPIRVRARLTVTDDEFLVDFTGSSRSVRGGSINSPYPATVSSVRTVFVAASDPPHTEPNGGFFRPVKVVAPEGSIFNPPVRPAPTSTYWESMSYAGGDLVWHILAELIPDKLSAGHFLTVGATIVAAWTTGQGGGESRSQSWNRSQVAGGGQLRSGRRERLVCSGGDGGETYLAPRRSSRGHCPSGSRGWSSTPVMAHRSASTGGVASA